MEKTTIIAALAALSAILAGCRSVEVEDHGEAFLTEKDGQLVLVDGKPVKYRRGWRVDYFSHQVKTDADSITAGIAKNGDISFAMNNYKADTSEQLGVVVEKSLAGAAQLAAKIGAAIATCGGSSAGEAGTAALVSLVRKFIGAGGNADKATVSCQDGSCSITDGTITETCTDCYIP